MGGSRQETFKNRTLKGFNINKMNQFNHFVVDGAIPIQCHQFHRWLFVFNSFRVKSQA